jgi:hypothetical protein
VKGVFDYLSTLSYATFHNCDCSPGHYYLLNDYNPGYNVDGSLNTSTFTVPPRHRRGPEQPEALGWHRNLRHVR